MDKKVLIIILIIAVIIIGVAFFFFFKNRKEEDCHPISGGGFTLFLDKNDGSSMDTLHVCIACPPDAYDDIPTPEREGYKFKGWYYDKNFKNKVTVKNTLDISPVPELNKRGCLIGYKDIIIYAKWEK